MSKKSASGSGSVKKIVRTAKGKTYYYWRARATTGYDTATGKQIQKEYTAKTQKEAQAWLTNVLNSVNENDYFEPVKATLGQWMNIWLKEHMSDKKYGTVTNYRIQTEQHIIPQLGNIKLKDLTPTHIQSFYNYLSREGKKVLQKDDKGNKHFVYEPLSAKTIRNIHGILTKALNTAVQMGYLKNNPADRVTTQRVKRGETAKEIHPLTDEQVKLFLKEIKEDDCAGLFETILFCGLREGEAMGLTWDCVDFNKGTITICKQLQKRPQDEGGYTFTTPKNGKTRVLMPAPHVMDLLHDIYRNQINRQTVLGDMWKGWNTLAELKTYYVFTNPFGEHLCNQTVYRHYKDIAKRIGAEDTCVHDLRHTYAVISLQNGDDIKTLSENLGHATAAFTLDVYGHVSDKMKSASSSRMQDYINSTCTA